MRRHPLSSSRRSYFPFKSSKKYVFAVRIAIAVSLLLIVYGIAATNLVWKQNTAQLQPLSAPTLTLLSSVSTPTNDGLGNEFQKYVSALDNDRISFPNAEFLPIIDNRNELAFVLEAEEKKSGVEVGVRHGGFAEKMLSQWPNCETYYLVDPWEYQPNYADIANVPQSRQNQLLNETKARLSKYESKTIYLRNYSVDAAPLIADNSVDFVYLDARHDYKSIWEDLELFWPKVKSRGIFAGHDFVNADEVGKQDWCLFHNGARCTHNRAVKAAVEEFGRKVRRQVITTRREQAFNTWYMRK